ncbi:hypothetical protein QKU48_gp0819 [Fadolivirus algeromassiliense]|jgi:hypothetical protein|uniref:Uncharacterized protein n=1 Tax=Fadolivirus FV1/VV64 TaxID=3070911 RepID=A0A7D3V8Z3_9VIRU|nr:hypothetical protein QKU48_gp0819 [Fadolivirus algeromassiliense]QKF94277.1 hypothetical protein Fadolivirus_1_819 [Fadolivirus FV1/VV64]
MEKPNTRQSSQNSPFWESAIPIESYPINGITVVGNKKVSNTCCFKSIVRGMLHNGAKFLEIDSKIVPLTYAAIFELAEFPDPGKMFDTVNPTHLESLERILAKIPLIQLHFFVGTEKDGVWFTTPEPHQIIGTGDCVIRILNKGNHFEFITSPDELFSPVILFEVELIQLQQLQQLHVETMEHHYEEHWIEVSHIGGETILSSGMVSGHHIELFVSEDTS